MAAAVRKNKTALLAEPDPEWKYYYASILAFCGQEEVAFALTCVYTILNPVNAVGPVGWRQIEVKAGAVRMYLPDQTDLVLGRYV